MSEIAVALLGGGRSAEPLAARLDAPVVATSADSHLDVARRLGLDGALVVGLASVPWPVLPDLHAEGSATLPAYAGVVSWHGFPPLLDQLAQAIAPGVRGGAHVLVTAPDPGPDVEPGDLMFLREVAEGLAQRVELPSRSIAWRGDTRTPTAVTALRSVIDAHGKRDILECPVAPGTTADPQLMATAEALGARLTCVDLGRSALLDLLAEVVDTVTEHETAG